MPTYLDSSLENSALSTNIQRDKQLVEPYLPEGQVPLDSPFYIARSPVEANCYKTVLQPGSLIRIKAPRRMGKTSLMVRILNHAAQENCQTVFLSFQLADREILQNLDKFLQWFSASVGLGLHLPNKIADYWDDLFGSKIYFEQYLLKLSSKQIEQLKAIACGQPYLTQLGLYSLWKDKISLEELFEQAILGTGIYANHLQRLLWTLENDVKLASSLRKVLQTNDSTEIELLSAFKLESLGLVKLQGNCATVTCDLYAEYFRERLEDY